MVANGVDTTATGLCANAGTIAGVNGATETRVANGATAYGSQSLAAGDNATAMGFRATATGVNASATGFQSRATGESSVAIGANALASAPNSVALGAGSVAHHANTVSVGSPGNERAIANVAPGVRPTDAVNVSQLQGLQQSIDNAAQQTSSGLAMAGALAGLPQVDPGKTFQVSAGVGSYAGYGAFAVGASARIKVNTVVKLGLSASGSSKMLLNAGLGHSW
jgi:autotransporter adhesin